jgi:hypothetical protein
MEPGARRRRARCRTAGQAALLVVASSIPAACELSGEHPAMTSSSTADETFTVVVLPDTQYYAARYPEILDAQTRWIRREREGTRIALVVHEGDIVDENTAEQWERAASSLHELDGVVPYVLGAGNHDYSRQGGFIGRETLLNRYFPASGFAASPSFKGTFEPGRVENRYDVLDVPGGPWLVLSLEFGPRDVVLRWANEVVREHAALPTILVTHAYLAADGARYDHLRRLDQRWNPHRYLDPAIPGAVNDGQEIWDKLVSRHDNIRFVLCGHELDAGASRLTSRRPGGSVVHQILANYQMEPLGGGGYLRIMEFLPRHRRVVVRTYSPYLGQFKTDAGNEFALDD